MPYFSLREKSVSWSIRKKNADSFYMRTCPMISFHFFHMSLLVILLYGSHWPLIFIQLQHTLPVHVYFFFFFLICSEFSHTLEWNSHGFTCVPHPDLPSHLPLHPLPLGFPSAPGPSACLMHPTWAGDLFHPRYYTCFDAVLLKHPTLSFSHRV